MEKEISTIRNKMIGLICVIVALASWQHEFVVGGVMSHLYMNLTILGAFAFGIVTSFLFISKLKNEVIALKALKEMWDDIRVTPAEAARDPLRIYHRCAAPARVFRRPRLLGHAYDLVTDELARTKKIRVSLETMNTLVHKIEETINDEKSLIVYMSGLLVFMGLIGTFIGLLHMVGAIGGIIGSLAHSSDGGEASGAFQKLLGALEEPLKGMASGFASSLFGLFSSLVIGLLGRFAGQAANVLKGEFESWLAEVVQLGEEEGPADKPEALPGALAGEVGDPTLIRMVGAVLKDYTRVAAGFEQAASALRDMRAAQDAQAEKTAHALETLAILQQGQNRLLQEMAKPAPFAAAVNEIGDRLRDLGDRLLERMEIDAARASESWRAIEGSQARTLGAVSSEQSRTASAIAGAIAQLSEDIERRTALPAIAHIESALERGVRAGFASGFAQTQVALTRAAQSAGEQVGQLALNQERHLAALERAWAARETASSAPEAVRAVEQAMADGFARFGQTLETAFSAYSSLAHVAVAALDRREAHDDERRTAPAGRDARPLSA